MRAALLPFIALCAACNPAGSDAPNAQEIERLSTPKNVTVPAPPRIAPLTPAELPLLGGVTPECEFRRGGQLLLAGFAGGAVAKIDGLAQRLSASAPVGPSGGFFENPQISISVGRDEAAGRMVVNHPGTDRQDEYRGEWACRTGQ